MNCQNESLRALCESIELPGAVTEAVASLAETMDMRAYAENMEALLSIKTAHEACKTITDALNADASGGDPQGYKLLTVYLSAALLTKDAYAAKGISENVFVDTMKCFTRFVKEHFVTFGVYGFDRGWWVYRQTSLNLFRLGVLEFEMRDGSLSVHIPSDAVMTREALDASYERAKCFFSVYFKDYRYNSIQCGTWLLSPALRPLLPEGSRILNFQMDYEITSVNPDAQDFMTWVYKKNYPDYGSLPEDTALQRAIKGRLLAGGKIGNAAGYYKYM